MKPRSSFRWADWEGYLYISPWLFGFFTLLLGPFVASLVLSFADWNLLSRFEWVGIDHYREMLTSDPKFFHSLVVTVYYVALHVPSVSIVAFLIAVLLNQRLWGIGFYRTIFYFPAVVAGVATAIMWRYVFNSQGVLNSILAIFGVQGPFWLGDSDWVMPAFIVMSLWNFGTTMVIYLAGLQSVPSTLYEAAALDGAGRWARTWHVTLPMMSPAILFTLIVNVIGSFQVFTSAFLITNGGPADATLFYALYLYRNAFQYFRIGYAAALAWTLFLIVLVLTLIQLRLSGRWVYYEGEQPK